MDLIENDASNDSSIVACAFVASVTFLPSRCAVVVGVYTYRHTDKWEGFIRFAVEMAQVP
jgi:hypothetical protein